MLDPIYVLARAVLFDALETLGDHIEALILVGAQAIYLHAGEGDLATAPYTTDGDLVIDPAVLKERPDLAEAMARAHFQLREREVGRWWAERTVEGKKVVVPVDLLVPAAVGGPGRRSARLEGHGRGVARKVVGLEACLVDNDVHEIRALDPADKRSFRLRVAGPGALLVAKAHKIADRAGDERARDKDALDIYRLLRATNPDDVGRRLRACLEDEVSARITREAADYLGPFFADREREGSLMAQRAAGGEPEVALAVSLLVQEVLDELG